MLLLPLLAVGAAVPPAPYVASASAAPPLSCLPAAVTRGATVVALSAYTSGGRTMPFLLAGANNNPVHTLTVTGRAQGPVVLVVAAYEPILWDLSAIRGRVRAVVASGYYPQAVTGLAPATPVRFSSAVGNFSGSETCGRVHYAYGETGEIQTMADDIARAIGTRPRIFYGRYSTERLDIDGPGTPATGVPDLADIRASVPLITEDDPQRSGRMRYVPSPTDDSGGARLRIVAWDQSGRIVRDEGGSTPRASEGLREPPVVTTPRPRRHFFAAFFNWLGIGIVTLAIWRWSRWRKARGQAQPPRPEPDLHWTKMPPPAPTPSPARPAAPPTPFHKQLAELTPLAAITDSEALVVALHRYGREVQHLSRTRFDADLAEEIAAIVERHFDHAVARYRNVRPSLDEAEGARADETLRHAIERLAIRLRELHAEQHQRDVSGVDEAARFIDSRHPQGGEGVLRL